MNSWSEIAEVQLLASKIITNSIRRDRVSHAYLIQGARGTGKEAIALLLAKSLFCEAKIDVEPCHICNACKRITSRNHPDVHFIEPDGKSIKIEQIKALQKEFTYSGLESNRKVYIIQAADTLTLNAANRLLKFLEEPSQKTTAIMLTENGQSIIPTIRSRCQLIDLHPLNPRYFQKHLIDFGMSADQAVLMGALTNNSDDAFTMSQDAWFAEARKLMLQLVELLASNPDDAYLFIHQHWIQHFKERTQYEQGLDLLLFAFKDLLYYHIGNEDGYIIFNSNLDQLSTIAIQYQEEKLLENLHAILEAKRKLKQNVHPTLVMEQLTLQIKR